MRVACPLTAPPTGKRKGRRSVQWLCHSTVGPVGLGIVVVGPARAGPSPQVVSPSGLPVQVRPTYPEPGLPAFSCFPPRRGDTPVWRRIRNSRNARRTSGTQGSSGTGASAATLADYQQYVGSYYGANEQCVSLTRDFGSSLPPSSQWQQGGASIVEGATDIAPGTPIATFNFNGAYGPSDSPGAGSGISHTGIYLGQDAERRSDSRSMVRVRRRVNPHHSVEHMGLGNTARGRQSLLYNQSERSRDAESSVSSDPDDVVRSLICRRQRSDPDLSKGIGCAGQQWRLASDLRQHDYCSSCVDIFRRPSTRRGRRR